MSVYADFDQSTLDREYSPSSLIENLDVYLDKAAVPALEELLDDPELKNVAEAALKKITGN